MQHEAKGMLKFVKDRELEHLLSPVKILMKQSAPKIVMASIEIEERKEGDLIEVPRWVAEAYSELGFAEVQEESFELDMLQTLSRERIQGSNQLSTLTGDFYLKLKRHLGYLTRNSKARNGSKYEYDDAYMKALDLITLRTVKLLPLAVGEYTPDIVKKVTPEELKLFNMVRETVQNWKDAVLKVSENE